MQLDAVEARRERVASRLRVLLDDAGNLARFERPRHGVVLHPERIGPHLAGRSNRRRRDERLVRVAVRRMADAADVHELREHPAALGVHGVSDLLPRRDLLRRFDRWSPRVTEPNGRRRYAFGEMRPAEARCA